MYRSLATLTAFVTDPPSNSNAATRRTLAGLVGRVCARVDRAAKAAVAAKVAEGVIDVGDPELHEVRKAEKRARYAAEVAGSSVGSAHQTPARRMEGLREMLGRDQDSLMARGALHDLVDRPTLSAGRDDCGLQGCFPLVRGICFVRGNPHRRRAVPEVIDAHGRAHGPVDEQPPQTPRLLSVQIWIHTCPAVSRQDRG